MDKLCNLKHHLIKYLDVLKEYGIFASLPFRHLWIVELSQQSYLKAVLSAVGKCYSASHNLLSLCRATLKKQSRIDPFYAYKLASLLHVPESVPLLLLSVAPAPLLLTHVSHIKQIPQNKTQNPSSSHHQIPYLSTPSPASPPLPISSSPPYPSPHTPPPPASPSFPF